MKKEVNEAMQKEKATTVHCLQNTGFSRTYVIEGTESLMAVDVGSYGAACDTVEYIRKYLKWDVSDLRYIAATHFHIDHIGGIGHLLRMCGDETKVLFNYQVKDYISGRKKISLVRNWLTGLMPASLISVRYVRRLSHLIFMNCTGIPLPGIRNIVKLSFDKDRISYFGSGNKGRYNLGFETWEVIDTPGHTEDSVSFFNETTEEFICGDLIVNTYRNSGGILNRFHWDADKIKDSFSYVTQTISPNHVYPGHGDTIRNENNALQNVIVF